MLSKASTDLGCLAQVMILSEGYLMFLAPPAYALHWFKNVMEFPYDIDIDGTVADWLISTVSVTFYKSKDAAARCGLHPGLFFQLVPHLAGQARWLPHMAHL